MFWSFVVVVDMFVFTAQALGYTCYQMYARQKTGLAPEVVNFRSGQVS